MMINNKMMAWPLLTLLFGLWASSGYTDAPSPQNIEQQQQKLEDAIASIKKETLLLNRDLTVLEQEILYPLMSQFSVYLSATDKPAFNSGRITLKVNDQTIADQHLTTKTIEALSNGGIKQLYVGKLKQGQHRFRLIYSLQGPAEASVNGEITHSFKKQPQAKLLELTMVKKRSTKDPLFKILEWE